MQEQLNKIFGTDFKVRTIQDGFKISIPSIDVTQLCSLSNIASQNNVDDMLLKRSGKNITVIITMCN